MHLEIQKVVAADYSSPAVQKKQIKQTNKKKKPTENARQHPIYQMH